MSHVVDGQCNVETLEEAREGIREFPNCELVEGQRTFKWFDRWVNDYHDPELAAAVRGFDPKEFGKCEHAIRLTDDSHAYEIGLVKRPDGQPGYSLLYDSYSERGRALEKRFGKGLSILKERLLQNTGIKELKKQGFKFTTSRRADGALVIEGVRNKKSTLKLTRGR